MKTQLVINHKPKERNMDNLTIDSCKNNINNYLTKMQRREKKCIPSKRTG